MFMQGTIIITEIIGRHGPFNVARLNVAIGSFAVKDSRIEQFKEGEYEGDFDVTNVYSGSYSSAGRLVVEVRALIGEMKLNDTGKPSEEEEPSFHVDPLDEETPAKQVPVPVENSVSPDAKESTTPKEKREPVKAKERFKEPQFGTKKDESKKDESSDDAQLFGALWPLADSVKLDPTLTRLLLRQQSTRLSQLGYVFDARTQAFNKT